MREEEALYGGERKCVMSNQLLGRELGVQMSYIHTCTLYKQHGGRECVFE